MYQYVVSLYIPRSTSFTISYDAIPASVSPRERYMPVGAQIVFLGSTHAPGRARSCDVSCSRRKSADHRAFDAELETMVARSIEKNQFPTNYGALFD
jgi:hypothetical protein